MFCTEKYCYNYLMSYQSFDLALIKRLIKLCLNDTQIYVFIVMYNYTKA